MVTAITIMVITTIIERTEAHIITKSKKNIIIYGRRKVGKTFLVKNFIKYDIYILIKRGGGIYIEGGPLRNIDSYDQFIELLTSWLNEKKIVIIDEFQRLPDEFLDYIQTQTVRGRLILSGSSFHTIKNVISAGSPVLGIFSDLKLSFISPLDIFKGLSKHVDPVTAIQFSPYLRDPWTIPFFEGKNTSLEDILQLSRGAVRALIGEVFLEEDKKLSYVYEGIVRSLAIGKWKLSPMADLLFSRKILKRPDPHFIKPYFNNMEAMDLVKRVPIYGKKEFKYMIRSPIMALSFMLDEKYNFFQQEISRKVLRQEVVEVLPYHIENFIGEFFAQAYNGTYEYFYSKDFDIDFIITRGNKVLAVGEVKWKNISRASVGKFIERTKHLPGDKIIFSKNVIDDDRIVSLNPANLLSWVKNII